VVRYLAPPPALVVFEDLHAADPDSVALFCRLALTASLRVLLVGTYRSAEPGLRPQPRALADLGRRRSIVRILLMRLSRTSVAELLAAVCGRAVSWKVADAVLLRTGGNPFFVEELMIATGRAEPELLASIPLPQTVNDAVAHHLGVLGEAERPVLEATAVLGSSIAFDVLRAVVGVDAENGTTSPSNGCRRAGRLEGTEHSVCHQDRPGSADRSRRA
jgi:predicted ATPase